MGSDRVRPTGAVGGIRAVHLQLTTACNLSCRYCYQERRPDTEMSWPTLRRTIDWTLGASEGAPRVVLSGGEPLLALHLIRRAFRHVEEGAGSAVAWVVQTNGLLLDPETVDFLADHACEIHLSFDGIRTAQDLRGKGTFERLDGLLEDLRRRRPELVRDRLTVLMTVSPDSIDGLADSVGYFLEKGVANVSISPVHAPPFVWTDDRAETLAESFERIGALSVEHFRTHGGVPLLFLRGEGGAPPHPWGSRAMCGVMRGRSVAVDVDGAVYGCAMLIEHVAAHARPWLAEELSRLRIGRIDDADLAAEIAAFAERAESSAILTRKEDKRSGAARCAICRAIGDCDLCPVSIGLIPGNDDPDRVPDFACAFYRTAFRMRERFLRESAGPAAGFFPGSPGGRPA